LETELVTKKHHTKLEKKKNHHALAIENSTENK